jgi:hypothetical protein
MSYYQTKIGKLADDAMIARIRNVLETINWPLVPGLKDKKVTEREAKEIKDWLVVHLAHGGLVEPELFLTLRNLNASGPEVPK